MGFLTGTAVAVVVPQLPPVLVLLVAALTCAPLCAGITVTPPSPKGDALANATTNIAGGSNRTVALLTNEADITASSSSDSATALNQTERFRRLIPYMTFYVPGGGSHAPTSNGDYLPVNQAYSYAPATQQNQQAKTLPLHPQQELQQQQQQQQPLTADEIDLQAPHILQQPQQRPHSGVHHNAQQQQQQHQNAPPVRAAYPYNGNNQHAHPLASSKAHGPQVVYTVRQQPQQQQQHQQPHPQHATIVYKTRHQANKPHKPYAPPSSNQPQQQQQPHQQTDANGQQLPAHQPQSQRINYSYQYLPQSPAVIPKKKLTPFLSTNQIPGEFRPVQQQLAEFHQQQLLLQQQQQQQSYAEYGPEEPSEGHNPSGNGAQHYQQQAQQQNHPENAYASYGPSSTPPSYVQFIKAIAPRPTTDSPPLIPAEAMPLLQSPHLMVPPPMSHQAYGSPSDHAANIGYNSGADNPDKVFYSGFDYGYTLDPDDGYDRRVPVATPARPSPVIAKGKYGGFSYRTTTAVPFVASPTPFRPRPEPIVQQYAYGQKLPATSRPTVTPQHNSEPSPPPPELSFDHKPTQRPFEHQPLSYEHVRAQKRPGGASLRPTPVPALDVRQHLTETTHVDTAAQRPLSASHPVHQYHAQVPSAVRPYHSHRVPPQRLQLETSTAATPSQVLPTRIIVPDEPGTSGEYEESEPVLAPHYPIREPNQHLGAYAGDESPPAPSNYADVLHKLQQSNLLPQRLNDGNIDVSIQSLVGILNALKQQQHQQHQLEPQQRRPVGPPAQFANEVQGQHEVMYAQQPAVAVHRPAAEVLSRRPVYKRPTLRVTTTTKPSVEDTGDYDYNGGEDTRSSEDPHAEAGPPGPNTGRPGIDYPALSEIPPTAFNCKEQRYKGFFGDPETNCQVWHYCDLNGGQASFLCPNGTIFSQVALTCDWWFNVKCSTTTQLYVLNERLYKYILPFSPKFPEDYSGPVVDKYLAMKYAEMEEKMRREKAKNKHTHSEDGEHNENDIDAPASSTEYGPDTAVQSAGLQATTVDGTLIDEEGQSHNVDSAIQYAAEGDTVRQHPQQTRPHFGHLRMPPAARLVATEDVSFVHRTTTVNLEDVEQSTGLPDEAGGRSSSTSSEEPLRTTMEPPLREVKPSSGTVEVESERVELIEIKSDGSTGHLTPVGYR